MMWNVACDIYTINQVRQLNNIPTVSIIEE